MIESLGTQGGRRYTQMRSVRSVIQKFRSFGAIVAALWIKRVPHGDPLSWNNRHVTTGNAIVGGGTRSFTVGPLSNFIFWSPRFLNFGTVVGGLDQWQKRTHGNDGWNIR